MKTEQEYQELFLNTLQGAITISPELNTLVKNYWIDLTSHLNFYFSHEDREQITIKAATTLGKLYPENKDLTSAWSLVIRDFISNQNWNFKSVVKKPPRKLTEDQKIFWKLFKYAWAFFQSMIILKIAVYYFGLESADHPEETNVLWVWFFFSLSAGSLAFFAYRNRNDTN